MKNLNITWNKLNIYHRSGDWGGVKIEMEPEGRIQTCHVSHTCLSGGRVGNRGGTWAVPCLHGMTHLCFVPLRVMPSRHARHVGPCRYGMVNLFFGLSTALKISLLVFSAHDIKNIYLVCYFHKF